MNSGAFFADRVAVVTGASSGIGQALARLLAGQGAKVVLAARRDGELEVLARELGAQALAAPTDVSQDASVRGLFEKTLQAFGRLDILVNNAGILIHKPLMQTSLDEARSLMETNYFGAVRCAQAALAAMRPRRQGTIVNVSSIVGRIGLPYLGHYGATKFALAGFSEALRQEAAPAGIHVCSVFPGTVATPMAEPTLAHARSKGKGVRAVTPEAVARAIADGIRHKRRDVYVPRALAFFRILHAVCPGLAEGLAWRFRAADPGDFQ